MRTTIASLARKTMVLIMPVMREHQAPRQMEEEGPGLSKLASPDQPPWDAGWTDNQVEVLFIRLGFTMESAHCFVVEKIRTGTNTLHSLDDTLVWESCDHCLQAWRRRKRRACCQYIWVEIQASCVIHQGIRNDKLSHRYEQDSYHSPLWNRISS